MKIRYIKKRQYFNLFYGLAWGALGIAKLFYDTPLDGLDYVWLSMAGLSMVFFLYDYKNQYLTIVDGMIYRIPLFGRKIKLKDIVQIKKFGGDYILKTNKREFTINTQLIDKESLKDLNAILAQLELPPEKTPFHE